MVAERVSQTYISPEDYVLAEIASEFRSEYFDGVILNMSGASPEHSAIVVAITGELYVQMKGKQCTPNSNDLRLRVPEFNRYYYPDLTVVCEEPQYETIQGVQSLLNPTLVIEVLSPTTEAIDRGDKFLCLQTVATLSSYILVAQDTPRVEVFTRQKDMQWAYRKYSGLDAVAELPEIDCKLHLSDIYSRVTFTNSPSLVS